MAEVTAKHISERSPYNLHSYLYGIFKHFFTRQLWMLLLFWYLSHPSTWPAMEQVSCSSACWMKALFQTCDNNKRTEKNKRTNESSSKTKQNKPKTVETEFGLTRSKRSRHAWDWKPRVKPEVTLLSENPVTWCSPLVCVSVCSCVWRPLPLHQHWLCVWREESSIRRRRRSQSPQCLWTQQAGGREGDTETLPRYLSVSHLSHPHLSVSLPPICPSLVCLSPTCLCCSCADPAGADSVRGGGVRAGERRHLSVAPCPGHDGELHFGPLPAEVPHRHPGRSRRLQEAVWEGETGRLQCIWEGDGSLFPPARLTVCLSLLQDPSIRGIFHFSSKQQMTKYEMGVSMAQAFNLPCDHLIPVNIINILMGCCILIVVTTVYSV